MKTWQVTAEWVGPSPQHYKCDYEVQGRTKADAIMAAQRRMASEYGLHRSCEAFVKVEFKG